MVPRFAHADVGGKGTKATQRRKLESIRAGEGPSPPRSAGEEREMGYLSADEYTLFGLEETTPDSLVTAASDLIDAHCRRKGFGIAQYMERFRVGRSQTVRLTYLPLASADGVSSPIVQARGRYTRTGREWAAWSELAIEVAEVFAAPALWFSVDPNSLDLDTGSGEVIVLGGLLSPALGDLEVTYTAGYSAVPEAVQQACAKLVKNVLATPALNVSKQRIDRMYLEYFADSLVDADVKRLLAPYVAQRLAS